VPHSKERRESLADPVAGSPDMNPSFSRDP